MAQVQRQPWSWSRSAPRATSPGSISYVSCRHPFYITLPPELPALEVLVDRQRIAIQGELQMPTFQAISKLPVRADPVGIPRFLNAARQHVAIHLNDARRIRILNRIVAVGEAAMDIFVKSCTPWIRWFPPSPVIRSSPASPVHPALIVSQNAGNTVQTFFSRIGQKRVDFCSFHVPSRDDAHNCRHQRKKAHIRILMLTSRHAFLAR